MSGWPFRSKVPFACRWRQCCDWRVFWDAVRVAIELRSVSIGWWIFWSVLEDWDWPEEPRIRQLPKGM